MTQFFDINNFQATGAETVYKLKTVMKSAGWSVPSSSDGTTYNSSGDQITSGNSGANGLANSRAWFRIQDPASLRELIFQRTTASNTDWRIKYSASARFTGGAPAATVTPSATDEKFLIGGGTDASPTFTTWFTSDNQYRVHMMASSTDGYGFWLACLKSLGGRTNSGTQSGGFVFDPLAAGSYPSADQDPIILYVPTSLSFSYSTVTQILGFLKKGLGGEGFVNIPWLQIRVGGAFDAFPGNITANVFNNKEVTFPVFYGRQNALTAPTGFKGQSSILRWHGTSKFTPSLLTLSSSKDRIVIGDFNLPWNGTDVYV